MSDITIDFELERLVRQFLFGRDSGAFHHSVPNQPGWLII